MATPRLRFQNMYECFSPPLPRGTFANSTVHVTINQDSSAGSTVFNYFAEPVVLALMPPSGPVSGGTYVEITGLHFAVILPSIFCSFNSTVVTATLVSSVLLQCITPHSSQGYTNVEVGLQRHDFSQSGAQFLFHDFVLTEVHPLSGPVEGNTTVVLASTNFPTPCINCHMNKDSWCKFGRAAAVPAYHDALDHISCVTPRYPTPGVVSISIVQADAIYLHKLPYRYEMRPYIQHAFPLLGPTRGGTTVTLDVRYLPLSGANSAMCRFGDFPVSIHVVSPTRIECVSPASPAGFGSLLLSTNDQDFVDDGLMFDTYHHPRFVSVAPLHGPTRGGTSTTITGSLIYARPFRSQHARCQIDSALVIATFISEQEIICSTPIHDVGTVRLQVTMNLQQFSDAGVFTYTDVGRTGVWPPRGAGGTVVHISDAQLLLTGIEGIKCLIGEDYVEASLDAVNVVKCTTPLQRQTKSVTISVKKGTELLVSGILFSYEDVAEVRSAHPEVGVDTGGTLVTLYGSGLVGAPSARCRFGEVAVPARLLSAGQLECTSPRPAAPGYVALEVSTNGRDFSASGVHFEYLRPVALRALEPVRGPVGGGTFVNVTGSGFSARSAQLGYVWCRFNTSAVAAAWARATEVHCIAPAHAPGVTVVALTLNEQQHTSGGARFEYEVGAAHSVHPSSGPLAGGTLVEVRGARIALPDGRGLFCQFGGAEAVAATHSSRELVRCVAPPSARGAVGAVALRLVNNDAVYGAAVAYTYRALVEVRRVHPVLGLRTGGTLVTLYGSGLVGAPSARCRFGEVAVPARLLSAGQLECTSPRPAAPGYVALEVSTNGRDFSGSGILFSVVDVPSVAFLDPPLGPALGGTLIFVHGHLFSARAWDLSLLTCAFNTSSVPAYWLSSLLILCTSPRRGDSMAVVEVANIPPSFSNQRITFLYVTALAASLTPASGPPIGDTLLSIHGESLLIQPAHAAGIAVIQIC